MSVQKLTFKAKASNFAKIPGSPIAYWVSEKMRNMFTFPINFAKAGQTTKGIITGNNKRFMRLWWEVGSIGIAKNIGSVEESVLSKRKWFYCVKGGAFRKWFGNDDTVINWFNDGYDVMHPTPSEGRHCQDYYPKIKFKPCISWSSISSGQISFRYKNQCLIDHAGMAYAPHNSDAVCDLLGFANSKVASKVLEILSPTLNFNAGDIDKLPIVDYSHDVHEIVTTLVSLSRSDWDEYETSWDFKVNPLVREGWQKGAGGMTLEAAWERVFARRMEWAARMKELEEENNRLFIEAYGLEDELQPDVAWKDVSITGNPFYRYKVDGEVDSARPESAPYHGVPPELEAKARADAMRELISYGMGVLMGRYSLEQEGLILASEGELYKDYLARVHGAGKILPDEDGVIPAISLEGNFFRDNLLHRMREFLSVAFGNDTLPKNLNFIEAALGCGFDKYLTDKFFDDHVKTYKKRPIYWLFESPKGYFRAFAYMHRMTGATAGHIRNNYLLPYIGHLEKCFAAESAKGSSMTSAERKRVKAMEAAIKDCKAYDLVLHDFADRAVAIDLDDGAVVNWAKYKKVLASL